MTFLGPLRETDTGSSTRPTSKYQRNSKRANSLRRSLFYFAAGTGRNAPRCMAARPTGSRLRSCSTWQRTWCACVRRSARGSRSWHPRRGSSTTRRTAFTRCFRRMPTASTGSMYPGSSSMSSIPSRTESSSMS